MKTYCFALNLQDDPELTAEYRRFHRPEQIWPEVVACIRDNHIVSEEIYLTRNQLFMILHTSDDYSLDAKADADSKNPFMRQWEALMLKYQKPLPRSKPGEKWQIMEKIFDLRS